MENQSHFIWQVTGAAVQGSSHGKSEIPCQDAEGYRILAGQWLLAALADGASTASCSDLGARLAVDAALDSLEAGLQELRLEDPGAREALLRSAFQAARIAIIKLAEQDEKPVREYAATLTCAVAGEDWLAAGQIGDSAMIVRDQTGGLQAVTHAQRGEYANETHFLTQEDALEQVEVQVCDLEVSALALLSDGLTRLAMKLPSYEPHPPFFQPLFDFTAKIEPGEEAQRQSAEHLAAFLASERVCARTDDDKSLVLAVRSNAGCDHTDEPLQGS